MGTPLHRHDYAMPRPSVQTGMSPAGKRTSYHPESRRLRDGHPQPFLDDVPAEPELFAARPVLPAAGRRSPDCIAEHLIRPSGKTDEGFAFCWPTPTGSIHRPVKDLRRAWRRLRPATSLVTQGRVRQTAEKMKFLKNEYGLTLDLIRGKPPRPAPADPGKTSKFRRKRPLSRSTSKSGGLSRGQAPGSAT